VPDGRGSWRRSWAARRRRCANWLRQDQADRGEREDLLCREERQRLRELERENRVLRQEREILKRAAAFFATETDRP
jgi:transposase